MSFRRFALTVAIAVLGAVQAATSGEPLVQPQAGTAAITGTVVTLSSREPIVDATVTLYASMLAGGRTSTTTDSQGHFQFTNLAAGRYTVGAQKTGFVTVTFGERQYGRGGRALSLGSAEHRDIRLQLPHPSAITGTILDQHGNPVIGAAVRAVRFSMAFGYRRADTAGYASTDAGGSFRIPSLMPGAYAVCASTRQTGPLTEGQRRRLDIDRERHSVTYMLGPEGIAAQRALAPRLAALEAQLPSYIPPVLGYAPVCYPGSASPLSMITLGPDEERTAVNIQFAATRLARIDGILTRMPADNGEIDPIMLLSADDLREGPPADSTRPDFTGRFAFTNVPPGHYKLFVQNTSSAASHGLRLSAAAEVVVGGEDIRNVVLDLQPGVTVSGRVVFRGSAPAPTAALMQSAGLQIRLDPARPGPLTLWPGVVTTRPDATGQFVLHDVFPGEYRISASQRELTGWFFDTTTVPGADVTGQLLDVKSENLTGVTVTLTDRRAEISGTIMTEKGEPAPEYFILVYPSDEKYWTPYSGRLRGARAKPDGTFVIDGLQPGSYRLATLLDAEFGAWFDPAFLHRIDTTSMALSIATNDRKMLHLRVPGDR